MDGTFMDTDVDYNKLGLAVFDTLVELGVPENIIVRGGRSHMENGVGWLKNCGRGRDADNLECLVSQRCTEIEMENVELAKPFAGAVEVLERLKVLGYGVGILTRGGRRYAVAALGRAGVLNSFDAVVARDDFPEKDAKPSPKAMMNLADALGVAPAEILYLGDSVIDWITARDSGAGFYGVLTGGFDRNDWKNAGKDIPVIDGVRSLLGMLD
jgi:phosphoglycolate phosphatase